MVNSCEARQPSRCVWLRRRSCSGPEWPASKACCAQAVLFVFVSAACCAAECQPETYEQEQVHAWFAGR